LAAARRPRVQVPAGTLRLRGKWLIEIGEMQAAPPVVTLSAIIA